MFLIWDSSGSHSIKKRNVDLLMEEFTGLRKRDNRFNIHLEIDENHVFQFLLIQTKIMKLLTQQFSSVLCTEDNFKVNIEGLSWSWEICIKNSLPFPFFHIFKIISVIAKINLLHFSIKVCHN